MNAPIGGLDVDGVGTVVGTVVNPAGLTLAKTVPARRVAAFVDPGLGASPTWHGFAIDQAGIAFTDAITVVGDQRIRIDPAALRPIGDGLAWAPGSFFEQDGTPVAECSRGALTRIEDRLSDHGLHARVGHEMEFLLVGPDGGSLPRHLWAQYGLAGVLEYEGFVCDVMAAAEAAGLPVEQFHPEYGVNQFEISLAPASPVEAADRLVLMRMIVGRVARSYGLRISLSPVPFAGGAGNGAHQHISLYQGETPLFSGGDRPHGMTDDGAAAIGGIIAGLLQAQSVLCGSVVSGLRMQPGNWAGAHTCWGTENREAAVRFLAATHGNPHGANVEVKIVDPSANPYFATAAILGLALHGIGQTAALPPEIAVDPRELPARRLADAGARQLPVDQAEVTAALDHSTLMREILGDPAVDALVAVRRYENDNFAGMPAQELCDRFRMAWSL